MHASDTTLSSGRLLNANMSHVGGGRQMICKITFSFVGSAGLVRYSGAHSSGTFGYYFQIFVCDYLA